MGLGFLLLIGHARAGHVVHDAKGERSVFIDALLLLGRRGRPGEQAQRRAAERDMERDFVEALLLDQPGDIGRGQPDDVPRLGRRLRVQHLWRHGQMRAAARAREQDVEQENDDEPAHGWGQIQDHLAVIRPPV